MKLIVIFIGIFGSVSLQPAERIHSLNWLPPKDWHNGHPPEIEIENGPNGERIRINGHEITPDYDIPTETPPDEFSTILPSESTDLTDETVTDFGTTMTDFDTTMDNFTDGQSTEYIENPTEEPNTTCTVRVALTQSLYFVRALANSPVKCMAVVPQSKITQCFPHSDYLFYFFRILVNGKLIIQESEPCQYENINLCSHTFYLNTYSLTSKGIFNSSANISCHVNIYDANYKPMISGHSIDYDIEVINGSAYGEYCNYYSHCMSDRNLTCANYRCACKEESYPLYSKYYAYKDRNNQIACAPPKKYNQLCQHNGQCQAYDANSMCNNIGIGSICECNSNYYWSKDQQKCVYAFKIIEVPTLPPQLPSLVTPSSTSYTYTIYTNYSLTQIMAVSFGALLLTYLVVLGVFVHKRRKQIKKHHERAQKKHFRNLVPHLIITQKDQNREEFRRNSERLSELKVAV